MKALPWLVGSILLLSTRGGAAQGSASICARRELWSGRLLRVRAQPMSDTTRGSVVGPLRQCADTLLVLGTYPGQEDSMYPVRTTMIRQLWVRGNSGTLGLMTGAASGAAMVGGIAAIRSKICFVGSPPVYTRCHGDIALNVVIGAAAGGLAGWVLGRGFSHWERIVP